MPGDVHVMIVDDNPDLLAICSEILEDHGYRVTACTSGLVALIRLGWDRPDVVVLDIKLDDVSGLEIYRAMQVVEQTAGLPVVFISGIYLDEEMVRNQAGDPNVRLLLKPVPGEVLIRAIELARATFRRAA